MTDLATPPAVKEHPLLFSAEMVRALLEGRKTQTRRVLKIGQNAKMNIDHKKMLIDLDRAESRRSSIWTDLVGIPGPDVHLSVPFTHPEDGWEENPEDDRRDRLRPIWRIGQRLWVKETFRFDRAHDSERPVNLHPHTAVQWEADGEFRGYRVTGRKRASIHMPRWASRITLEIEDVRIERLNEIVLSDVWAEGIPTDYAKYDESMKGRHEEGQACFGRYRALWESINGPGSWEANPWIWAITFKVIPQHGAANQ